MSTAAAPTRATPIARRPTKNRRRWFWPAVIVVVLAIVVGGVLWHRRTAALVAPAFDAADLTTVAVGDIEKNVESSGTVAANLTVDIKCRASGEVTKLPFDISETVKKGDLLCQLDPSDQALAVRSAEAQVAQSVAKLAQDKASLQSAELNLVTTRHKTEAALASAKVKAGNLQLKAERQKELVAQQLGAKEDFETAQTEAAAAVADEAAAEVAVDELKQQEIALENKRQDIKTSEAQLDANQINLDTLKRQLDYTTVLAPIDGTVSALDVQLGTIVASGTGGFSGGTTILTLTDLSRIFVTATVDQSDIGDVRVGQTARIAVDSYLGRTFEGKVVRIAPSGASASNVVTFEVKVEVLDKDKQLLKPAMTGTVTIVEETRKHVLQVQSGAVSHSAGKIFVTTTDGKQLPIKLGLQGSDAVEILDGAKAGQQLVLGGVTVPSKWNASDRPK